MRKLFKSKKALSPVIATIILIAVTVAVSIAVAAWMGALTFGFMATEQVAFTGCTFSTANNINYANVTVKNTGTSTLTLNAIIVNNQGNGTINSIKLTPGLSTTLRVNSASYGTKAGMTADSGGYYVQGNNYAFTVVTTKNNQFGPYTATAPS